MAKLLRNSLGVISPSLCLSLSSKDPYEIYLKKELFRNGKRGSYQLRLAELRD